MYNMRRLAKGEKLMAKRTRCVYFLEGLTAVCVEYTLKVQSAFIYWPHDKDASHMRVFALLSGGRLRNFVNHSQRARG